MTDSCTITVNGRVCPAQPGQSLLEVLRAAGLHPDAPCGGKGMCGKCRVQVNGVWQLACQTKITCDLTVTLPEITPAGILTSGRDTVPADGQNAYAIAFDIGTTTLAGFLLDGKSGRTLASVSALNPQIAYGADVISRIQHVLENGGAEMQQCIRGALAALTLEACQKAHVAPTDVTIGAIAGNTAMHHLLLGLDTSPLVRPPYMPAMREAMLVPAEGLLPIAPDAQVRVLPNIAGFVGADTVGCLLAADYDRLEPLSLIIDIGTNGEMVLGNRHRRIACSTAAGPAFEGAKIHCGMRGAQGAIDHVSLENGRLRCSVIGGGTAAGLCGSGLLDAVACALDAGLIDPSGRMDTSAGAPEQWTQAGSLKALRLQDDIVLTQKDVREVQLAKSAIRAGIELMARHLGFTPDDIQAVYLAGAFGNYLDPASACRIGLIPPYLLSKIIPVGNAAGSGVKMAAVSKAAMARAEQLAATTEFLELASLPEFQDEYVDRMAFEENRL